MPHGHHVLKVHPKRPSWFPMLSGVTAEPLLSRAVRLHQGLYSFGWT